MKDIAFGMDKENCRTVTVSELHWQLLKDEAEASDITIKDVLQFLLAEHFNIGRGGGASEQIALTIYYDVDDLLRRLSHEKLHFDN